MLTNGGPMNLQYLKQRTFAPVEQRWNWKDCALYAMGIGYGTDPLDERELDFVYEQRAQQVVPSFCMVLWRAFIREANSQMMCSRSRFRVDAHAAPSAHP
jgi:hypothetical protein